MGQHSPDRLPHHTLAAAACVGQCPPFRRSRSSNHRGAGRTHHGLSLTPTAGPPPCSAPPDSQGDTGPASSCVSDHDVHTFPAGSISQCCCCPRTQWPETTRICYLTVLEVRRLTPPPWAGQGVGRAAPSGCPRVESAPYLSQLLEEAHVPCLLAPSSIVKSSIPVSSSLSDHPASLL